MSDNWFILALASALFSAAAALLQKIVLRKIDAVSFSFFISIANLVLISLFWLHVGTRIPLEAEAIIILTIKVIISAIAFLCVMISIENFELSSVLPVLIFTPALVAIVAFVFLGESLNVKEIVGMSFALLGVYILEAKEKNLLIPFKRLVAESKSKYILYALALFTISSVLDKTLISKFKVKPFDFLMFQQVFALPVFAFIFFIRKNKKELNKNSFKNTVLLILAISVLTLLYRFFYVSAIQFGPVALALSVKRFSVFFAVLASGKILKEKNIPRKLIATFLLIAGSYLLLV